MNAPASVVQSVLVVELPLRTVSEANVRDGWRARAKRMQEHRAVARMRLHGEGWGDCRLCTILTRNGDGTGVPRLRVTLTRIGPKRLDDDNVRGALKGVRDGVADALGIDDADPRVTWRYEQTQSLRRNRLGRLVSKYGVRIEIAPRGQS